MQNNVLRRRAVPIHAAIQVADVVRALTSFAGVTEVFAVAAVACAGWEYAAGAAADVVEVAGAAARCGSVVSNGELVGD